MEADSQNQNGQQPGGEKPPDDAPNAGTGEQPQAASAEEARPGNGSHGAPQPPEEPAHDEPSHRRRHHVAPALISLDRIVDDDTYKLRDEGEVDLLATDLARVGQLFPVEVRLKPPDRFQVICGFRRLKALRMLHREKVLARLHTDLTDEDALLMALAAAIHQQPVPRASIEAVRDRLDAEGRMTALLRDMLDKALNPDQQLEPERYGEQPAAEEEGPPPEEERLAEEEIDADELAGATAAKLGEINQDLALLADVFASLDDERKLELLKQLRYSAELVAYLEGL